MISIRYKKFYYPEVNKFPDGTFRVNMPDIFTIDSSPIEIVWTYAQEQDLSLLIYITENLKENYKNPICLYMPYVPNARMDRVKATTEIFTLKYFCKIINYLAFDKVKILDVHSPVAAALLERCENLSPEKYIKSAVKLSNIDKNSDYIFLPDESSYKRYAEYFKDFRYVGFGIKNRDWQTGIVKNLDIHGESPRGRKVLIVDDICSYGGTAYHSSMKLREQGCKEINLYFTHCEKSIYSGKLLTGGLIKNIYTTNSLLDLCTDNRITVFDCLK